MPGKASSRRRVVAVPIQTTGPRRLDSVLTTVALVLVMVGLIAISFFGVKFAIAAVGVAVYVLLLAVLGTEKTAVLTLMAAFATAPMYKGLAPSIDSVVTPTDLLFVGGFFLLLPTMIGRSVRLPLVYFVGLIVVTITGCIASAGSVEPLTSFLGLVLWLMVMGGLPIAFALWRPGYKVIELLAWAYVVGQLANTAWALIDGPYIQGRYAGNSLHPNYFGQAGMMAIALLLYLFYRHRTRALRLAVLAAGAVCLVSVHLSGSRAAMLVVAVLIMMIPVIDRSAISTFIWFLLGALAIAALPLLIDISGEQSALARLSGNSNAALSDRAREEGFEMGWERFWDHPLLGNGLIDLFEIHNNFLEVAVAVGVFGLAGYLLVLFAFARPLFGLGPDRRLCYTVWAYIGFGATIPSLYDRSIWGPVALSVIAIVGANSTSAGDARPAVAARPPDALVTSSEGR